MPNWLLSYFSLIILLVYSNYIYLYGYLDRLIYIHTCTQNTPVHTYTHILALRVLFNGMIHLSNLGHNVTESRISLFCPFFLYFFLWLIHKFLYMFCVIISILVICIANVLGSSCGFTFNSVF